jgi:signal transduction histidine kinase
LGLSLAYDIIKAHGGEIKVETKVDVADPESFGEGNPDKFGKAEGSEFTIQLPTTPV